MDGRVLIRVANLDDAIPDPLDCALTVLGVIENATGHVLSGARDAYNTFGCPDQIKPAILENITLTADGFQAALPACSVTAFEVAPK